MRVEGYSMDVYCDSDECRHYNPRHGQRFTEDFHGRNRAEVNRLARRDGWLIGKRDLCPACAKPVLERNARQAERRRAKRAAESDAAAGALGAAFDCILRGEDS